MAVLTELHDLFARLSAFEFVLQELQRFPKVLYLAPSPAELFKTLTHAVVERYLENRIREAYPFVGTPLRLSFRNRQQAEKS